MSLTWHGCHTKPVGPSQRSSTGNTQSWVGSPASWTARRDEILASVYPGSIDLQRWVEARGSRVLKRRAVVARYLVDRLQQTAHRTSRLVSVESYELLRLDRFIVLAQAAHQSPAEVMQDLGVYDYTRLKRVPPALPGWPRRASRELPRTRVAETLKGLRVYTGASIDLVAREIGRTHAHVRNIEKGRFDPRVVDLVLMADAYNVTITTVLVVAGLGSPPYYRSAGLGIRRR